jgi:hypothetical protein
MNLVLKNKYIRPLYYRVNVDLPACCDTLWFPRTRIAEALIDKLYHEAVNEKLNHSVFTQAIVGANNRS